MGEEEGGRITREHTGTAAATSEGNAMEDGVDCARRRRQGTHGNGVENGVDGRDGVEDCGGRRRFGDVC